MMKVRGCAFSTSAATSRGTPSLVHPLFVCFSAEGMPKLHRFFSPNLFYISGDFHTFGPFPEGVVVFQVNGTVYIA